MIRIGSRASPLALWQAEHVRGRLASLGREATIVPIVTEGDRVQNRSVGTIGGKAAFLKEIEEALLAKEVDLGVHSLKDVPTRLPPGLALCACLEREDPRDAFLSRNGTRLSALPQGSRIGTTSLRRASQIRALRPDIVVKDLRGNVDTRIRRLGEGLYEGIILAVAGLRRLGRDGEITEILDISTLLPAPGQGAIALEGREGDQDLVAAVGPLTHEPTSRAIRAERAFLETLGGDCNVPLGAYAQAQGNGLLLRAVVARPDGSKLLRGEKLGQDPEILGRSLASDLLDEGAGELLGR